MRGEQDGLINSFVKATYNGNKTVHFCEKVVFGDDTAYDYMITACGRGSRQYPFTMDYIYFPHPFIEVSKTTPITCKKCIDGKEYAQRLGIFSRSADRKEMMRLRRRRRRREREKNEKYTLS